MKAIYIQYIGSDLKTCHFGCRNIFLKNTKISFSLKKHQIFQKYFQRFQVKYRKESYFSSTAASPGATNLITGAAECLDCFVTKEYIHTYQENCP